MSSSAAAQVLRQAETVKSTMTDSGKAFSELWVTRQKLEDLYKKLLLMDLEYALDKKVEQELWNHAFKNQINILQTQSKDRQNPKKQEAQASLFLFLETASGFYLQFLQTICSTFKLDLPFRKRSAAFGIMRENTINYKDIVTPKKSSCLYICCHCLVHLGDIARYRGEMLQAQTYYRHAANLSPNNGQPYNQLAILEASQGDKLSTVFYYVRSLAVRHPFPVAATNLEKFYSKLIKDTRSDFDNPNMTMTDIILAFLQFQALLHMCTGLDRASTLKTRITSALASPIRNQSVSAAHLTGVVAISIFALHRARCDTGDGGEIIKRSMLSSEEERCIQIHISFAGKLLEVMLQHTPKEDNKARDFLTLPAIKVMFDWLSLNKDVLLARDFNNTTIWSDFCKLLNTLQWLLNDTNKASDSVKYEDTPLPEDTDLRCFQPLEPTYSSYNFNKALTEELSPACERDLRCQRLVAHGKWIAQDLSRQKLLVFQPNKSIRTQFSTQKAAQSGEKESSGSTPHRSTNRQNVALQTIMKKRLEQEKGSTSPLSAISEEGRSSESSRSQGDGPSYSTSGREPQRSGSARQAGVINLHHKNTGPSPKANLPPRLSAKAGLYQNTSVSPRLQKKNAQARNNTNIAAPSTPAATAVNRGNQEGEATSAKSDNFRDSGMGSSQEVYPSLSPDNYPALISQRSPASLITPESSQSGGQQMGASPGILLGSSNAPTMPASSSSLLSPPNWGSLNLGREGTGSVGSAPSPSVDSVSSASRSPQPSPSTGSSYPGDQLRNVDMSSSTGAGVQLGGFPAPSADFMNAIRSATQFVRQQQQQQQNLPSMLSSEAPQQYPPQHPTYTQQQQQQHLSRMLSAQQQHQKQQQMSAQQQHQKQQMSRSPHGIYPTPGMRTEQTQPFGQAGGLLSGSQPTNPLSAMNLSPAVGQMASQLPGDIGSQPSRSGKAVGYQASRAEKPLGHSFMSGPAPVGYIPPASLTDNTSGFTTPTTTAGHMAMSRNPAVGPTLAQSHPGSFGSHSLQTQQNTGSKQQTTGLLYQNIPLAGSNSQTGSSNLPTSPSTGPAAIAALFQPSGVTSQGSSHHYIGQQSFLGAKVNPGQEGQLSSQDIRLISQDPRLSLSTSFQGHAAGTPKPEKSGQLDIQMLAKQQRQQQQPHHPLHPHHHQQLPPGRSTAPLPGQQQQQQQQHMAHTRGGPPPPTSQVQQSMIHAVMDPPFLQASGEYTLFNSGSSPAWHTPLVKTGGKPPVPEGMGSLLQQGGTTAFPGNPGGNLQGMWSNTGPSPLERLLEQQRTQRQGDS